MIKIDDELESRVEDLARRQQRSTGWILDQALRQYVDREESRAAFQKDALKAWRDYQATGQHVTQAQADAWLARLEDGDDADLPRWHS
ncbi:CopG family ribbon-helix-helix protein [Tianweitania aestuarii]|uniref:CopG family ribbon-helix-helix protein n=1 Tax=Tianweitania aestuarii TaxID=2814886 RepID=UPI003D647224